MDILKIPHKRPLSADEQRLVRWVAIRVATLIAVPLAIITLCVSALGFIVWQNAQADRIARERAARMQAVARESELRRDFNRRLTELSVSNCQTIEHTQAVIVSFIDGLIKVLPHTSLQAGVAAQLKREWQEDIRALEPPDENDEAKCLP